MPFSNDQADISLGAPDEMLAAALQGSKRSKKRAADVNSGEDAAGTQFQVQSVSFMACTSIETAGCRLACASFLNRILFEPALLLLMASCLWTMVCLVPPQSPQHATCQVSSMATLLMICQL